MTELDHYKSYLKTMINLQKVINDEVLTTKIRVPTPPTILQYIEMIKVLNNAIDDIKLLKDDLRVR